MALASAGAKHLAGVFAVAAVCEAGAVADGDAVDHFDGVLNAWFR